MWSLKHANWEKCWVSCNINSLVPLCLVRFHHTSPSHVKVALNSTQLLTTTLQSPRVRFGNTSTFGDSKPRSWALFLCVFQMRHPTSGCAFLKLLPSWREKERVNQIEKSKSRSPSWWMMLVFFQIPKNSRWYMNVNCGGQATRGIHCSAGLYTPWNLQSVVPSPTPKLIFQMLRLFVSRRLLLWINILLS